MVFFSSEITGKQMVFLSSEITGKLIVYLSLEITGEQIKNHNTRAWGNIRRNLKPIW